MPLLLKSCMLMLWRLLLQLQLQVYLALLQMRVLENLDQMFLCHPQLVVMPVAGPAVVEELVDLVAPVALDVEVVLEDRGVVMEVDLRWRCLGPLHRVQVVAQVVVVLVGGLVLQLPTAAQNAAGVRKVACNVVIGQLLV